MSSEPLLKSDVSYQIVSQKYVVYADANAGSGRSGAIDVVREGRRGMEIMRSTQEGFEYLCTIQGKHGKR